MVSFLGNLFKFKNKRLNLNSLICKLGDSEILENTISVSNYPFKPSVVYPERIIKASEIDSVCADFGFSKIMIKDDIVFFSTEKKEVLKTFAKRNSIPLVPYSWNWDWILEPYLDTELTEEGNKKVTERLLENGFTTVEIDSIRNEVGKQMYKYNFHTMLWEWCSLSLFDVLSAMRAKYTEKEFRDFYKRAIEIEKRNTNKKIP